VRHHDSPSPTGRTLGTSWTPRRNLLSGYKSTRHCINDVADPRIASAAGPLVPIIDAILEADKTAPPKQRHTAKRIFERLRIEHGFAGG
jgi:hypothetical protein